MAAKRIGILTGGGDVPGLNSVIKTVVYRGSEIGCEVIGIRRGWEGLTHVNLQDPGQPRALHPAARIARTPAPSTAPAAPTCTVRAPTPPR